MTDKVNKHAIADPIVQLQGTLTEAEQLQLIVSMHSQSQWLGQPCMDRLHQ